MANFVTIRVPNIRLIALVYDRIAVYRAPAYGGAYVEVTTPTTRIALEEGEREYIYVDSTGVAASYYRYEFRHSVNANVSAQSEQFQGVVDITLPILTADELRSHFLFGIPLEDPNGVGMSNETLDFYIAAAITYAEKMIDIVIRPTTFAGESPQPADDHDYYKQDYERYMWLQLLHVPVISVSEVRFTLPATDQSVTFDSTWVQLDRTAGVVQIVPGSGQSAAIALGLSTMWLPVTQGLLNFIPETFAVDYVAGFADNQVPADIKQLIGYLASIDILAIIGDILFGPGVAGSDVGLDVLMTRLRTSRSDKSSIFGARIKQYTDRATELIKQQRLIYKGVRLLAG